MTTPINSMIERIGRIGRNLDAISALVSESRKELLALLDDIQEEIGEHGKIIDRVAAGFKESFEKQIRKQSEPSDIEELRREDEAARELDPQSAQAQDIERNR